MGAHVTVPEPDELPADQRAAVLCGEPATLSTIAQIIKRKTENMGTGSSAKETAQKVAGKRGLIKDGGKTVTRKVDMGRQSGSKTSYNESLDTKKTLSTSLDTGKISSSKSLDARKTKSSKRLDASKTSSKISLDTIKTSSSKNLHTNKASSSKSVDTCKTSPSKSMKTSKTSSIKSLDVSKTSSSKSLDISKTSFTKNIGTNKTSSIVSLDTSQTLSSISLDASMKHEPMRIICLCGAGISVSAGIPDFRSPGTGLYSQLEKYNLPTPQSVFSLDFFLDNPEPFCKLAKEMFPGRHRPTPTHAFMRLLQDKGLLLRCYTYTEYRHLGACCWNIEGETCGSTWVVRLRVLHFVSFMGLSAAIP